MLEEISAGGLVVFRNTILLLKKFNGDWVLPKGRVESDENIRSAALREVWEEAGVRGNIISYIGKAQYNYKNYKKNKMVHKKVFWFLMFSDNMQTVAQKEEGFIEAIYVHKNKAAKLVKYKDEKEIIEKGLDLLKGEIVD